MARKLFHHKWKWNVLRRLILEFWLLVKKNFIHIFFDIFQFFIYIIFFKIRCQNKNLYPPIKISFKMHQHCKSQFSDFGRTNIFQEFNMDACKNVGQTNNKIMLLSWICMNYFPLDIHEITIITWYIEVPTTLHCKSSIYVQSWNFPVHFYLQVCLKVAPCL